MLPDKHILFGLFFSISIFLLFPQIKLAGFLIIAFSSILIDIDHYIYYFIKKRDFNPFNACKWYYLSVKEKFSLLPFKEKKNFYVGFFFLHGVEISLVFAVLGFILSEYFFFVSIGIFFHLFLDVTDEMIKKDRIDKVSIIYDFLKYKRLRFIDEA